MRDLLQEFKMQMKSNTQASKTISKPLSFRNGYYFGANADFYKNLSSLEEEASLESASLYILKSL